MEPSDETIAQRVQNGETFWFAVLVERYEKKLERYAKKFLLKEEAEDILQEVFSKAFENIQSFDSTRRFSPWIYRIAHNEFVNKLRKRSTEPKSFLDSDTVFPQEVLSEDDKERNEELKKVLELGLSKVEIKYREPLVLYYYGDLDYKEISDVLHIPVSTVGVRLKRGREILKKLVEESGEIQKPA